jgi:hypothetical protein
VDFNITSVTTNTAHFDASYGPGCVALVSGTPVAPASVDVNCQWTLTFQTATFTDTTGAGSNVTVDLPCQTTITIEAIGCTIHVLPGRYGHITTQNIDTTGASSTSASPTGVKLTPSIGNLTYTATGACQIAEHGTATYTGPVYVKNLWGML